LMMRTRDEYIHYCFQLQLYFIIECTWTWAKTDISKLTATENYKYRWEIMTRIKKSINGWKFKYKLIKTHIAWEHLRLKGDSSIKVLNMKINKTPMRDTKIKMRTG
jgi:hypothetical protein